MKLESGKFFITEADSGANATVVEKDGLVLGRMQSCDIVLNHRTVSRAHAGINCIEGEYFLINLSVSNSITLNGRLLSSEEADVLADGDIIQIGTFLILVTRKGKNLELFVSTQFTGELVPKTTTDLSKKKPPAKATAEVQDVLKVFWEKRTRDKDEYGMSLRPTEKPLPGKALINWRPTNDLARPWRFGIFTWSFVIIALIAFASFKFYPQAYSPKPLSNPHTRTSFSKTEMIANQLNENSCTTCHTLSGKIEDSCLKCHQTEAFHGQNTKAHSESGIGCTSCHFEHQGEGFEPRLAAFETCVSCHNDNNKNLYNGKSVATPHKGGFGYVTENGQWKWNGVSEETAETMPDVIKIADAGNNVQLSRNKQFHAIHLFRLKPVEGLQTDKSGSISCSSCHKSFDPLDRETPKQTCAICHSGYVDETLGKILVEDTKQNCVSCHVQHPYDKNRWSKFLTDSALQHREKAVELQIKRINDKQ
ncbi:MAG: FHA domain-containing protein [Acidobacteria bacterium]|nr:FHA domain-containing protein [Acidobacteriota bacterium]